MNLWRWNKGIARGRRRPAVAAQGRAGVGRALRGPAPQGRRRSSHGMINDADTLRWLAQQNCITPHIWNARCDQRDKPDRLVFDLDPTERRLRQDPRGRARRRGDAARPRARCRSPRSPARAASTSSRRSSARARRTRCASARGSSPSSIAAEHPDTLTTAWRKEKRDGPDPRRRRPQHLRADDRRALRRARRSRARRWRCRCTGTRSPTASLAPAASSRCATSRRGCRARDPWADIDAQAKALPL